MYKTITWNWESRDAIKTKPPDQVTKLTQKNLMNFQRERDDNKHLKDSVQMTKN
jgi:hypothetical protein